MEPVFEKRWEARHPLSRLEAVLRGYTEHHDVPACECRNMLISVRDSVAQTYFDLNELRDAPIIGWRSLRDADAVRTYVASAQRVCSALVSRTRHAAETVSARTPLSDLLRMVRTYHDGFGRLFAYYNLSRPDYTQRAAAELHASIARHAQGQEAEEAFGILTTPSEQSLLALHELEQLRAAARVADRPSSAMKEAHSLAIRFGWISTQESNPPLGDESYLSRIGEILARGHDVVASEIAAAEAKPAETRARQRELARTLHLTPKEFALAHSLARLAHLRLLVRFRWTEASFLSTPLFSALNVRLGYDERKISSFFLAEYLLRDELHLARIPDAAALEERARRSTLLMRGSTISLATGDDAEAMERRLVPEADLSGVDTLHGMTAQRGQVRAKAWVIAPSTPNQAAKATAMEAGRILVAAMTRPQLVSCMRRAAGIITDEGGVTCHAAIVSRELGTPCVIGTKHATQVIRDGDELFLDADHGIVTITRRS